MDISELMWDKKYAPKTIDDMVLEDTLRNNVKEWIASQTLPQNLLFCGLPGTGKTTLADIITKSLNCDVLRLTAQSGKNGVEYISQTISDFVQTYSFKQFKVVVFDEVDRLNSLQAQKAMLSIMDEHKDIVRFIFTANHINKIEDALISRCLLFKFKVLEVKQIGAYVCNILNSENIKYDKVLVKQFLDKFYPDVRGLINQLQYSSSGGILQDNPNSIDIEPEIFDLFLKKDVTEISKRLSYVDFPKLYRYFFDHIAAVYGNGDHASRAMVTVATYLYRDQNIADREVNFRACCMALIQGLTVL